MMKKVMKTALVSMGVLGLFLAATPSYAEELPPWLYDRGKGVQSSLFGTYIEEGDYHLYVYYEYYKDGDEEYQPDEFGISDGTDYYAETTENEFLIFLGYGLTEDVILEFEAAYYTAKEFKRDPDDLTGTPDKIEESGLGDVESQIRWRWNRETATKPEYFSFFEVVFPFQENKDLIGTQNWELALGFGAIKGLRWGTLTGRLSLAWSGEENGFEPGEYGLDYLKRLSDSWRVVASIEGTDDEVELIGESQHALSENATLKLNAAVGLTKKATDFAPEVGVMWKF